MSLSAATFTVTTGADSGAGSLDQAILDANATSGLDTIGFNIGAGGPQTILTGALPVITDAVVIDGTTQPGYTGTPIVTLDGNDIIGAELRIQSSSPSTIRGLVIIDMGGAGIRVETGGATITGNYIGVDASGTVADGNFFGIDVQANVDGVVISGNVISGNSGNGVQLSGTPGVASSDDNIIQGNIIGLDALGLNDLGNSINGIAVDGGSNNRVGGLNPGEGNVISGNGAFGIRISATDDVTTNATGNVIQGNRIGTSSAGTSALPNSSDGVGIFAARQTSIGGAVSGAGNLISGNAGSGIVLSGTGSVMPNSADTVIAGNWIGTDSTGAAALGNGFRGITLNGAIDSIIGGVTAAAANVISGNASDGVSLSGTADQLSTGNVVQGNRIGTDAAGTAALPNGGAGILFGVTVIPLNVTGNVVGGMAAGEGNTIRSNIGDGIAVLGGVGNAFLGNSIDLNGGLGIDIGNDGVTPNDAADTDGGPNNRQNYPVLTAVNVTGSTAITGTFNSTPVRTFRIEFFRSPAADPTGFGEGRTFLGFTTVVTDAVGNAAIVATFPAIPAGTVVTATATDMTTLDSSEFSNAVAASFIPPTLSIGDVTVIETHSGTTDAVFNVTLTYASPTDVTFQFATADGTAMAPGDYSVTSGNGFIAAGTTSTTITVPVVGDPAGEPDETFFVNITGILGATAGDIEGQATIENDDAVAVPAAIPTLSQWMLALFAALIALGGAVMART